MFCTVSVAEKQWTEDPTTIFQKKRVKIEKKQNFFESKSKSPKVFFFVNFNASFALLPANNCDEKREEKVQTNPDQWSAPILLALKQAHQVFLTEFGCHERSIDGPAPASAVPQIEGSCPSPDANAPQSASRNVVPPLTLLLLTLLYSSQSIDSNLDCNAKAPSIPAQRVITAQLMRFWPSHQYVFGDISLTRSEQNLGLQSSQRFKACPTDPDDTIFVLHG